MFHFNSTYITYTCSWRSNHLSLILVLGSLYFHYTEWTLSESSDVLMGNLKVGQIPSMFSIRTGHNNEAETISCHRKRSQSCRTLWQTTKDQGYKPPFQVFTGVPPLLQKLSRIISLKNAANVNVTSLNKWLGSVPYRNKLQLDFARIALSDALSTLTNGVHVWLVLATVREWSLLLYTSASILLFLYKRIYPT